MKKNGSYTPTGKTGRCIHGKLRSGSGFSIGEMLVCCLILLLCSSLISGVFPRSITQFRVRTRESAAWMLCNTLSLAIQDELAYASRLETEADGTLVSLQSGAYPELSGRDCRFVYGYFDAGQEDMGGYTVAHNATEGQILLEAEGEGGLLLPLASSGDYGGAGGSDTLKAKCLILFNDDCVFQVTVTVTSADPSVSIHSAENTFYVTPVKTLTASETIE